MVHLKQCKNMVLACEGVFSRSNLDSTLQNLHTFLKVNLEYILCTCTVGQAKYSFCLPFSHNLPILLARGSAKNTNAEPWSFPW